MHDSLFHGLHAPRNGDGSEGGTSGDDQNQGGKGQFPREQDED